MKTKFISLCAVLLCATSLLATNAETYDCLHSYYNAYTRVSLSSVRLFSTGRVEFDNFINYGLTILGQSNAQGDTITCEPGQLVTNSNSENFLYVYENSSVNTTKNIQFVRQDFPDGIKWVCTSTILCYAKQDGSSPIRFSYIAFDTRKNATVETEVWKASDNSFKHYDMYRAYVHQNIKGNIYIDYFGRLNQAYFHQNSDGGFYSVYEENPIVYSSNYQNTYKIAEAILTNDGTSYSRYNYTLNGTIVNNTIYLDPWSMVCDNRNNTSASEEYRKISIKDSVCKNMSITLDNSYSLRLPNPHTVSDNELILTTQENFLDAATQYWMWTGNKQDELSAIQITNKASTIEPGTDQIIEKRLVPGLNIKNHGNGSKNIYAYVTACSSVKYYVTSNGSDERTALVRAISENGNDTIESTLATPSTGAVGILEGLNPQEVYEIEFYTSEKDMTLYALQFNAPIHMDILNQACDAQPTKIMKDGSVVILKGGAVYNLLGTKLL